MLSSEVTVSHSSKFNQATSNALHFSIRIRLVFGFVDSTTVLHLKILGQKKKKGFILANGDWIKFEDICVQFSVWELDSSIFDYHRIFWFAVRLGTIIQRVCVAEISISLLVERKNKQGET